MATAEAGEDDPSLANDAVTEEDSTPRTTPKKPRVRRPKVQQADLDQEQEDETIQWVHSHEVLYNRRHPRFKQVGGAHRPSRGHCRPAEGMVGWPPQPLGQAHQAW